MAWFRRRPTDGLIFHPDRGSQYASGEFQKQLVTLKGSMKGRLLGQRRDRNALRFVEGRAVARNALCDTPSGKGRRARLTSVLRSSEASLDTGISQPDGLREKSGLPIKEGSPHNRSAKGDAKRRQVQPILPEKSNPMQASSGFPQRVPICLSQTQDNDRSSFRLAL
jgi:hypothetical protein